MSLSCLISVFYFINLVQGSYFIFSHSFLELEVSLEILCLSDIVYINSYSLSGSECYVADMKHILHTLPSFTSLSLSLLSRPY